MMLFRQATAVAALMLTATSPGWAQSSSVAAAAAADADLAPVGTVDPNSLPTSTVGAPPPNRVAPPAAQPAPASSTSAPAPTSAAPVAPAAQAPAAAPATTYAQQDVLTEAENVFGRGAEGLAKMIEKLFQENGEPTAYIVGREAGGAIAIGLRYGSGTLFHRIEGQKPIYWTGPSLGFDLGADASKTFTLVYNLHDTEELFHRFPAVEGKIYVIGGFTANYLQRGNVMLVPIKLGVGWRLGANVGYLNFTHNSRILPF